MNIDDLTNVQLVYVTLISVGVVYFVLAAIKRVREDHSADRRRR